MKAEIISIGDELLIGQVINTNASWIAKELNLIGVSVFQITTISDEREHILQAFEIASKRVDLVIITGGLGPTSDDITKPLLCEFFNTHLIMHDDTLNHVKELLMRRGVKAFEINKKQAEVPACCTVIKNPVGTAPCMWLEKNHVVFISMPGVPFEMEEIMKTGVIPKIKSHFKLPVIIHKTIQTSGIPESMLSERLQDWEKQLPEDLKLAYLPAPEGIRLRLTIEGNDEKELQSIINNNLEKLNQVIPEAIFGYDNQTIQEIIGILLKSKTKTLATAESCTGGYIAKLITEISGCSKYYLGSVVAYSNAVKENVLQVNTKHIQQYGAVSQQVVEEMAKGVLNNMNSDYAIATSGIAGPDGGSIEKPVGTVWIAVASKDKIISKSYVFGSLRDVNIRRASNTALNLLRKFILEEL